ncbi:MAG TPA: UDP-N-acetylglucosamine 2-epimerase (non-hydrolyzing) [Methyloceanibacter sp.]|nr:UDP-N-acetylglucosamine 2-epimerase (non-hydrolyzing) [Methyloceanibacter sp.]
MRVLSILGTRPEAIKMVPVIKQLEQSGATSVVCVTAQHRKMLDSVLDFFGVVPDIDLDLMQQAQTLTSLTARVLNAVGDVLDEVAPDVIVVQGDTTTAMGAAMAAFYRQIPVAHVEAGLRSGDLYAPFPEEMNRIVADLVSRYHFVPTELAANVLRRELADTSSIHITGNTVIDALLMTVKRLDEDVPLRAEIDRRFEMIDQSRRLVLVTGHRRESFGRGFKEICLALKKLSERDDIEIVYPVHLNPNVQGPVRSLLSNIPNMHLIEPVDYPSFVRLMQRADLILTDSGGIQEEAPSLDTPVLVMRTRTERREAIDAGAIELVGTEHEFILERAHAVLDDATLWQRMAAAPNPFGDGRAAERIVKLLMADVASLASASEARAV